MDGARRQTDTGAGPHGDAAPGPRDASRPGPRDDAGRHPLRDAGPGSRPYPYNGPPEPAAADSPPDSDAAPPPPLPAHGIDTARSLEELEGDVWPAPGPPVTALVEAVHALRRRPVGALGTWDMIRLLGQRVGAAVLVPVALDLLRASLPRQATGGWFEDDLLAAVAAQPPEFWAEHPHWHAETARIADAVAGRPHGPAG